MAALIQTKKMTLLGEVLSDEESLSYWDRVI